MGEFLKGAEKNKGGGEKGVGRRGKQCPTKSEGHSSPTLDDIGISYKESSQAQALAELKQDAPVIAHMNVTHPRQVLDVARYAALSGPMTSAMGPASGSSWVQW